MGKERKPQTVVAYLELEDNCGAILAKTKVEIPVLLEKEDAPDDATVRRLFDEFVRREMPSQLRL